MQIVAHFQLDYTNNQIEQLEASVFFGQEDKNDFELLGSYGANRTRQTYGYRGGREKVIITLWTRNEKNTDCIAIQ